MSEENVEAIVELARLFEAGDWDGVGAHFTEDAELHPLAGWPEPGPHHGRAAIVHEWQRITQTWDTNEVEIRDHTARDDRLVICIRWIVEGGGSGVPTEMTFFAATRFEDGQIAEWRAFWNRPEALEAAGLQA